MKSENVLNAFPEISEIKSKNVRGKVIEVWSRALANSGWKNIHEIPFGPDFPTEIVNLVTHVRSVTNCSLKIGELMHNIHGLDVNKDHVIAGALLHDVSKVMEYGTNGKTDIGNLICHPVYGIHLCIEVGLPLEVTHIVVSHTKKLDMRPKSIEAIIVHHCDLVDLESMTRKMGRDVS